MIEKFSGSKKQEFAYLENRPDLFETKILRLKSSERVEKTLLVASRDPGSGNAIVPVLKELEHDAGLRIDVLTDGYAQERFEENFETEDVSPDDMLLGADKILHPKAC